MEVRAKGGKGPLLFEWDPETQTVDLIRKDMYYKVHLDTLRAKECIDSAFFISQTNELEQKISALRAELQRYRDINDYQELLDGTRTILDVLSQAALDEFQPAVFKKMISRIIAGSQALRFQLINGLELVEPIERWPA